MKRLVEDERGHSPFPETVMILVISVVTLFVVGLLKIYFPVNDTIVTLVIVAVAVPIGGVAYYWAAKRQKQWMIETLNARIYWLRNGLPQGKSMEQLAAEYFQQCPSYECCEFRPWVGIEKRGIFKRPHLVFGDYETYCTWKSYRNWPGMEADLARLGLTKSDLLAIPDDRCCWERNVPVLPPLHMWPPRCEQRNAAAVSEK